MKKIFLVAILLVVVLTGCSHKELSPEMQNLLKENGLTKEQVCKGNNMFRVVEYDPYGGLNPKHKIQWCNEFVDIEKKHIKLGLEYKKFETVCNKMNGGIVLDTAIKYKNVKPDQTVFSQPDDDKTTTNALFCRIIRTNSMFLFCGDGECKGYYLRNYKNTEDLFELYERKKGDIERNSKEGTPLERIKALGISEDDVLNTGYATGGLTHTNIDVYLKLREFKKQEKIEEAEREKALKIQNGKQYICTDGYDSWILKYNDSMITFGDRPFKKNPVYGWYERFMGDPNPVFLDRENSTITYSGNKATCRPR